MNLVDVFCGIAGGVFVVGRSSHATSLCNSEKFISNLIEVLFMDNEELEKKLDIIFDKENFDEDGLEMRHRYHEPSRGRKSLSYFDVTEHKVSPLLIQNPEYYELHFPSHKLLMGLFGQISNNETNLKFFIDYMRHKIVFARKSTDLILAFDTLFRLDYIEKAFNAFYIQYQYIPKIENTKDSAEFVLRIEYLYSYLITELSKL